MPIDSRVRKSINSLKALKQLISELVADPVPFNPENQVHAALRSQGSLARFESTSFQICPSSINTIKRNADLTLEGGFAELDELRRAALNACMALQRRQPQKKSRASEIHTQLQRAQAELQVALQDNWIVTMALDRSLKQGRYYASQSPDARILALCDREQKELRAMFSLRKPSNPEETK